jgi:hypothetical protein
MGGAALRRLFLHIGVAKTGSSALQVAFARNTELLEKAGINYWRDPDFERAKAGKTTQGNGLDLCRASYPDSPRLLGKYDEEALRAAFPKYFGRYPRALLSSEMLGNLPPPAWLRILKTYPGTSVHLIAYVRNAGPSLWSAYCHIVKEHGFSGTFREFLNSANGYYIPKRSLSWACRAMGTNNITALHYESHADDIATPVFKAMGIAADKIEVDRVNTNNAKPVMSDADRDLVTERFGDEVTWVNQTFFDGKRVVTV